MASILNIRGRYFVVEGDGFVHAETDLAAAVSRIEDVLRSLDDQTLDRYHAGARMDADMGDFIDRAAWEDLDALANRECSAVVAGWHNPGAASVSVSAQ